jgi:cbb3-type cytochrome oxidase subunit 3
MKTHEQLMIQRRRWINSSYFAFMYVFRNYYYNVMESKHNFVRKYVLLGISMGVALLGFVNGYLVPAFYCFVLYTTIVQSASNFVVHYAAEVLTLIYIFLVLLCVVWSLYGQEWTKKAQYISYIFSFYTFVLLGLVIYNVIVVYI